MHELSRTQIHEINEIFKCCPTQDKFNVHLNAFIVKHAEKNLNPQKESYQEDLIAARVLLRHGVLQYALSHYNPMLFIWLWMFFANETTVKDFVTPVQTGPHKGKTALWLLATQIDELDKSDLFLEAWIKFRAQLTVDDVLRDPIKHITILWSLARGAKLNSAPFCVVWNDVRGSIIANVLCLYPESETNLRYAALGETGISAFWLLAQATSKGKEEALLTVLNPLSQNKVQQNVLPKEEENSQSSDNEKPQPVADDENSQESSDNEIPQPVPSVDENNLPTESGTNQDDAINYDAFLAQAEDGLHQGITALYWLALAAAKGFDRTFLKVTEMFPGEMTLEHLRVKSKEGCSALFWLAVAAKNGKREAFSKVWFEHKAAMTLADLKSCPTSGEYQHQSIRSLLSQDPVFAPEIEQKIFEIPPPLEEIVLEFLNLGMPSVNNTEIKQPPCSGIAQDRIEPPLVPPQPFYGQYLSTRGNQSVLEFEESNTDSPTGSVPFTARGIMIPRRQYD